MTLVQVEIDDVFDLFSSILDGAISKHIPTKIVNDSSDPPWYNKKIKKLKKTAKKLHWAPKIPWGGWC